jgi:RHS repeat-associated protein
MNFRNPTSSVRHCRSSTQTHRRKDPAEFFPATARLLILFALVLNSWSGSIQAAQKSFILQNATLALEDVSTDVEVFYRSMRLNRALNVWNVEVTVTNRGARLLPAPIILLVDEYAGTSGVLHPDGTDDSTPGKAYFDLSGQLTMVGPGHGTAPRTLSLGLTQTSLAPQLTTRVFALTGGEAGAVAFTRALNAAGQPLDAVQVDELGPQGGRNYTIVESSGWMTLGNGTGLNRWKFSKAGFTPVWRESVLGQSGVQMLPHPRLTPRSAVSAALTPLGGGTMSASGIQISFAGGAFGQAGSARVTPLGAQNLPGLLPAGWSPLQAFWFESEHEPLLPGAAALELWDTVASGETAALARWNDVGFRWEVLAPATGNGTRWLSVPVALGGAYAVVVADQSPGPPAPVPGEGLPGMSYVAPDPATLSASGVVHPASSPASKNPELVTAQATVTISHASGPLSSGLILRGDVTESYRLRGGAERVLPRYETVVIGYRRPADLDPATLRGVFPMRPLLLFGADELDEAVVRVELFSPEPFRGTVFGGAGGQIAAEEIRLIAGVGSFDRPQAATLRRLEPALFLDLAGDAVDVVLAFEFNIGGVVPGGRLLAQIGRQSSHAFYVLARVAVHHGIAGFEPVERFAADESGTLSSLEPAEGERLPGITGAGQYVLLRVSEPHGLVTGTARNAHGIPARGLLIRMEGEPWLTFSDPNGSYRLIARPGPGVLLAADSATGDSGAVAVEVGDPGAPLSAHLGTRASGPRVLAISPEDGAARVSRVTPIVIAFSKPLNPGTLLPDGIQLTGADERPVPATLTLNLRNTIVTLLPNDPLAPNTVHRIRLSPEIADASGMKLEERSEFTFTTIPAVLDRSLALVSSYEPENGLARMVGSPGMAEPEAPVILVNETTGRTATVLSKPDGSFDQFIEADVDDFLSAVLINHNGTQNTIPVSRQIFGDGRVALFNGGGILEAESDGGPVQVLVEPGAIDRKNIFKIEGLTMTEMLAAVKNTPPESGKLLGGFRYTREGGDLQKPPAIVFPVRPADLDLPPGVRPEDASYALTIAREINGVTAYEIMDRMHYENGHLVTRSPPYLGIFPSGTFVNALLLVTVGDAMTVTGRVLAGTPGENGQVDLETAIRLPGAHITVHHGNLGFQPTGGLRPGALFATSMGTNAVYAIMVPGNPGGFGSISAVAMATHPRFFGALALNHVSLTIEERFAIGNILGPLNLIFPVQNVEGRPDTLAPRLSITHNPFSPEPGAAAEVRAVAIDNASRPHISIDLEAVTALLPDETVTWSDVTISAGLVEEVGSTGNRRTFEVVSTKPARVVIGIVATDESGNRREAFYPITFGGEELGETNPILPADPNDRTGPRVVASVPSPGSHGFSTSESIKLYFSKPIDRAILKDPFQIQMVPFTTFPVMSLSPDQQELTLTYYHLQPETEYTLTATPGIRDLLGYRLDQEPESAGETSYVLSFRTAPLIEGSLPGLQQGEGVVTKGIYAYAIERAGPLDGALVVFDLSDPGNPQKAAEFSVPGQPRDLVLIPQYSFVRRPGSAVETKDLIAVVGGRIGQGQAGQYLWIIDISEPRNPKRVAATVVNNSPVVAVTKLVWDPPMIGYLEIGDVSAIGLVNLQAFIYGLNLTPAEFAQLPIQGDPGLDADGDGNFVGPEDRLPLPSRMSPHFAGKVFSYVLPDTEQLISDFWLGNGGDFVGVAVQGGYLLDETGRRTGERVHGAYRTLFDDEMYLPRAEASFDFPGATPTRVTMLFNFPLPMDGAIHVLDLALVSLTSETRNWVAVLDVTDRTAPRLITEIDVPTENGRPPYSILPREDGLLMLATRSDLLLLDPAKFAETSDAGHPALVGFIPNAGSGAHHYFGTIHGLHGRNQGGTGRIFQMAPRLRFVCFPDLQPFQASQWGVLSEQELASRMKSAVMRDDLAPSRYRDEEKTGPSALLPPNPETHYYVMVFAPGSAGETIELALQSLNWAGAELGNKGFLFPPVHALSGEALADLGRVPEEEDAPVRSCRAWRLSNNPGSEFYNVYLSRPIALVYEEMSKEDLVSVQAALDREILWSGHHLRASIDPSMAGNVVFGPFASRVNMLSRRFEPGPSIIATTFPADLIMGPNPFPITGGTTLFTALGSVGAHNAELRVETSDMVLPGRRLPIDFKRVSLGQNLYEGPFGRGWDFNFNQRLVEISPRFFPEGRKVPQVIRTCNEDSEIAGSGDLLFHNGAGRALVYRYAGTEAPSEIAADPLVQEELKWIPNAAAFYLPPPGAFNFIVRFKDGNYARLEPDGTQYWYNPAGKLKKVYDRFDKNSLELVYNSRGELIQILDELKRKLDIGYWRLPSQPEHRLGLDRVTRENAVANKICSLQDYSGRDVLFFYDAHGLLVRREGPAVTTAAPNGFTGRQETTYSYTEADDASKSARSLAAVVAGDETGQALVAAAQVGEFGRDTVGRVKIAGKPVLIEMDHANSARALAGGNGGVKTIAPDNAQTAYSFDGSGRVTRALLTGDEGPPQETKTDYFENGLVKTITYPEGNKLHFHYDFTNRVLRSRGNILRVEKDPGPRPGNRHASETTYDAYYNLALSKQDFNGVISTIELTPDRREKEKITKADHTETYEANEFGQIIRHTAYDGVTRRWSFNESGFLTSRSLGDLVTTYQYGLGAGLRGLPSISTDPRLIQTMHTYDERNQLVSEVRSGVTTSISYDERGNIVRLAKTVDAGRTLVEERNYSQSGFLEQTIVRNIEVNGTFQDLATSFESDEMNRVTRATFPGGDVHDLTYDHLGRLIKYTIGGVYIEEYTYDLNGNKRSVKIGEGIEMYEYDGHDRLVTTFLPNGARIELRMDGNGNVLRRTILASDAEILMDSTYQYDPLDRVKSSRRFGDTMNASTTHTYSDLGRSITMTDALGAVSRAYYDSAGRVFKETYPGRELLTTYDGNGNVIRRESIEQGVHYVELFEYDLRDKLIRTFDNAGVPTEFEPGFDGRILATIDREGHRTRNDHTVLGEVIRRINPNEVSIDYTYNVGRDVRSVLNTAGNGLTHTYDVHGRITATTLPNGEQTTYHDFDPHNAPRRIHNPRGITVEASFDFSGMLISRTIARGTSVREESYRYDGLNRPIHVSDPSGSVDYAYDKLGFIKTFRQTYAGSELAFEVSQTANAGGFRTSVTYPFNAVSVSLGRDNTGRLLTVTPSSGEPLVQSTTYATDTHVGRRTLGDNRIELRMFYDPLKRQTTRRYRRISDGKTLIDLRFAYNRNGGQLARQFVHRAGRADLFRYDPGNRLVRADVGARLQSGSESERVFEGFAAPGSVPGSWAAGLFARTMSYSNIDVPLQSTLIDPDALSAMPFASDYAAADILSHVPAVDGFERERDEIGNVTRARLWVRLPATPVPVPVGATLEYDLLGQLTRIAREDGVVIQNEYNLLGLRIRRTVTGDPSLCVPSDTIYFYDGGNLIMERDAGTGAVLARYYYGDEGDELIAGDLALESQPGLRRHYFLTDPLGSVLGIVDQTGQWIERVMYDAWGQPLLQSPDPAPPRVSRVIRDGNDILVQFSEPVLPGLDSVPEDGLATQTFPPSALMSLEMEGDPVGGIVVYEEALTGFRFGTVYRFRPLSPGTLGGNLALRIHSGAVQDEWGNPNVQEEIAVDWTQPSGATLFTGPSVGSTEPVQIARSRVHSSFLFHGQVFDYETGLVYCRARFYDPSTGLFLQPDPAGLAEGANLYAAFANNPINLRDSTGMAVDQWGRELALTGSQASYEKDGVSSSLIGVALEFAGAVLSLGRGFAEGLAVDQSEQPGTLGLLDATRSADLMIRDMQVAAGAFGVLRGSVGVARRMSGFTQKRQKTDNVKFLMEQGLNSLEVEAILYAMQKNGVTRMSIRSFGNKAAARRANSEQGMQNKPAIEKDKTNEQAQRALADVEWKRHKKAGDETVEVSVTPHNRDQRVLNSDVDILHLEKGARPMSVPEVNQFIRDANRHYIKLHEKAKWPGKPNPPFQHGSHTSLTQMYGNNYMGKPIGMDTLAIAGHPGDSFTIRMDGRGNVATHQTPRWQTHQDIMRAEAILKNKQIAHGHPPVGFPKTKNPEKDWYKWANE